MNKMTGKQEQLIKMAENCVKYNEKDLITEFERIAELLKSTANEVEKYIEKIKEGDEIKGATQEEYAAWAINEVENMMRNLNFSRTATAIVNLSVAKQELKNAREQTDRLA
jgi:methionyl-tRNA formyltransferase